jgi:GNAT superfamily N-acetyltransferase
LRNNPVIRRRYRRSVPQPSLTWVGPDHPEIAGLVEAQQRELAADNPPDHVPYPLKSGIEFVLLRRGDAVLACAALQRLDPRTVELKRMYVVPPARGRRLSKVLLAAIAERAREYGVTRIRLETSLAFRAAVATYRSSGYVPIPPFGDYLGDPLSYCMELVL